MATNLTPPNMPPCRTCGRGGHFCHVCGRKPEDLPEDEGFIRNDLAGTCLSCLRASLRRLVEHMEKQQQGGRRG